MKKIISISFIILLLIATIACSSHTNVSEISINNSRIEVEYLSCFEETKLNIDNQEDIAQIENWISQLELKEKTFKAGEAPNEMEGGKAFVLTFYNTSDSPSVLTYFDGGTDHHIQYDHKWYKVEKSAIPELLTTTASTAEESPLNDLIPMVCIDGKLYIDTGKESDIDARCGVMDGEITSQVENTKKPSRDNESNFGIGFGYQFVEEGKIDILINKKWYRFEIENSFIDELALVTPVSLVLQNFSSKGATFIINNETDKPYTYGEDYSLQAFKNGTWETVPYSSANWGFEDIGYEVTKQSHTPKMTIDWVWLYGELPDGQYRLIKTIINENESNKIYGDFELVNGKEVKVSHYIITELDSKNTVVAEKDITDETSLNIVKQAIFNVLVKSSRFEMDTSSVTSFYKVTTVYSNNEISNMTFYEVNGKAYGDGTICDYELYKLVTKLVK